jgi:hypothetical protein
MMPAQPKTIPMKQISKSTAEKLAMRNKSDVARETRYAIVDWLTANAHTIADVETGRANKTLYGEWPKGWKAQMMQDAKETAKMRLVERFLADHCKVLDGVIWLGDWQMINEIAA